MQEKLRLKKPVIPARSLLFDPNQNKILKDEWKPSIASNEGKAMQALEIYRKHVNEGNRFRGLPDRGVFEYEKALWVLAWAVKLEGVTEKLHNRLEGKLEGMALAVFRLRANEARRLAKDAKGEEFDDALSLLRDASHASGAALEALANAIMYFGAETPAWKRLHPQFEKFRVEFCLPLSEKIARMEKVDDKMHPERKLEGA